MKQIAFMMRDSLMIKSFVVGTMAFAAIVPAVPAHPGRTNASGCHTCRTNCSNWGLKSGETHCHGTWVTPPPPLPAKRLLRKKPAPKEDQIQENRTSPESSIIIHRSPIGDPRPDESSIHQVEVEVLAVVDGGTFVGRRNGRLYLLKLRDIEPPDVVGQPYGQEARERLSALISGQQITIWPEKAGECVIPVRAETPDGTSVAERLLLEGLVWASQSASDSLDRLQERARLRRVGLWQDANPEPPWKYHARTMAQVPKP